MAEMNEASIYEALGVAPKGESEKTQEAAAPAATEPSQPDGQGERAQEPAAPAPDGKEPTAQEKTGAEPADAGAKEPELTEEQRRTHAAQRRRQEQEAAIQQAVNAALEQERARSKSEWDAFFKKANLKNTITGVPITSLEEFQKWEAEYSAAKLERDLKAGKLTPEALNEAISKNPTVQRAQQIVDRDDAEQQQKNDEATQAQITAEIAEIHKLDASINTAADLLKMPNAKEFYDYVRRGYTFFDAYYMLNRARLEAQAAEAAKAQAMSAARSKDHLNATGAGRGAGAITVPAEDMKLFKLLNPDATEAEIQAYYNKSKKN